MEKKLPISKNKKFIYSITYQHTDEESSELGEYKEIGFEVEKSTDTIGKILKLANENYNIYYPISVGNWESTSPVEDRDYWEKGIHKFYVLHINNEDGTSISEEENNFITYLLSNGQYNSEEFEEFYLGGLIIGGLIGGYIGYYYGKNPRKKYDFGGEVVGNEVTYNYYGEEQTGNILEVLDDTALVVQTGTNKRLVDGSDVIKIHYNNSFDAGGKIQEEITYLENRIYNLEQLRDVAGEDEIEYYNKIIKDLEEEKSKLMRGEVEEEPKKKKFFFFADGGKTDEFDFDEKMALINLDMCYEYSVKLDKMVSEDTQLEDWVKMKLTIVEQNIADVKHALEGWEKFGEGGMIFKKQLLHIAKYSKELIEMIQKGSRLMSWQENKLAVSSAMIDAIYHHLDYEFGNRASKLKKEKYAKGGGVKKRSLMSMANLVDWKGEGIKKWYMRSYPTDELGEELNDDVTFKDLWDALNNKQDVYEIMGVADSVVRERLFEYLSLVYDVDYDVVYKKWLDSDDYAKGGSIEKYKVKVNQYIPYRSNKGVNYFYVVDENNNTINKNTGKVYRGKQMNNYKFSTKQEAERYAEMLNNKMAKGGGVGKYYNGMSKEEILSKTIVYDNQGETLDRYTIFTPDGSVFGMSENASGFNQYIGDETEIEKGKHLGKKLTSVPKDIEWAVLDRMIEEYADGGFMEEVVTKPKVAPTPVTTPKPNTDNPYKPKTKTPPKAKYDFLLLNK